MTDRTITPFLFEGEVTVRVIDRDGELWFVAADVCRALGLTNPTETVRGLDDDEKGISTTDTLRGNQEVVVISESGLYALIFKSRKPHAVRFRKWVTSEVLPKLRTQSQHSAPPPPSTDVSEAIKLRMVREARQTFGTRASADLWFRLGLPVVPGMSLRPAQVDMFIAWTPPGGSLPAPN